VSCDTQEEIDRYWDALLQGGTPEQCGWLKDRYGLSWQIVPEVMLKQVKFDIAELKRAAAGEARV
jgi:predicted 3-demethylubiquinone-9 3-methyltransferase (glyoxalase superfamily)